MAVIVATIDHSAMLAALDPSPRFQAIATRRVTTPGPTTDRDPLAPVALAPSFPQAAVDSLVTIAPDLLLPGLDTVTPNTVTLASTDQRFVEAFLLGMNHELDRELRWRGYPTVPGSTYFRRFWDTAPDQADIDDIADWTPDSALGSHGPTSTSGSGSATGADTVLVVRGDLVRRYPGIAVTAIPLVNGAPAADPAAELSPVLRGTLDPDVLYAGFAFPPTQAADFAYILTQQPGAPRFGLDEQSDVDAASVAVRNDLAWSQLGADVRIATAAGPLAGRTLTDGSTRIRGLGPQLRRHGLAHPTGADPAGAARTGAAVRHGDATLHDPAEHRLPGDRPDRRRSCRPRTRCCCCRSASRPPWTAPPC